MLTDRREFACIVVDVSEGGIALLCHERGSVGEQVIVYIDRLGRVQGTIVRQFTQGLAIALNGTSAAFERFAARLRQIANSDPASEKRREVRVEAAALTSRVRLSDGQDCEIEDLSIFGAGLRIDQRPCVGELLDIGLLRARVVRHSETGIGVEFIDADDGKVTLADRFRQIIGAPPFGS